MEQQNPYYYRQPGPKNPSLYPYVGNNYNIYGEQPGFVYYYPDDSYYVDPNSVKETYQATGHIPEDPKAPGMLDTLLPVAGVAGAGMLAKEVGKGIGQEGLGYFDGFFGTGGGTDAATNAATQATQATAPTAGGGFFGTGSGSVGTGPRPVPGVTGIEMGPGGGSGIGGGGAYGGQGPIEISASPGLPGEAGLPAEHPGFFAPGTTAGNILGGAGVALGAYGAYQGIKDGNPLTSGMGGLGMGLGLNQLGFALGPWGWAAAVGLPVVASMFGVGDHVTTKEQQGKNWSRVAADIDPDSITGQYMQNYQQHIQDPNHPKEGPKKFEDMNALDLTPGLGFFETFGRDWLEKFNEPQRIEIARRAKEAGMVRSSRGDILVDDKDRLREIGMEVFDSGEQFAGREQFENPEVTPEQVGYPTPEGVGAAMGQAPGTNLEEQLAQFKPGQRGGEPVNMSNGPQWNAETGWNEAGQQMQAQKQALPQYYEGAPAGTYLAPDGVNTYQVDQNGQVMTTSIGVPGKNMPQGFYGMNK